MLKRNIILTLLVSFFAFGSLSFVAYAQEDSNMSAPAGVEENRMVHKEIMKQARVEVLAELLEKSVEEMKTELKDQNSRSFMRDNEIDRETFHNKMKEKIAILVQAAVAEGKITPEKGEMIVQKTEEGCNSIPVTVFSFRMHIL